MSGFNLSCQWSQISTSVAILSSLVTLDLSNNAYLQVLLSATACFLHALHACQPSGPALPVSDLLPAHCNRAFLGRVSPPTHPESG